MTSYKRLCWLFAVLALAAGCNPPAAKQANVKNDGSSNGAATRPAQAQPAGEQPSAGPGDFTLSVSLNKVVDGDEETAFRRTYPKPSAIIIEEQVKSIDWASAPNRPYVIIGRIKDGGVNQMKMQGTIGTANDDGLMRVLWIGMEDGQGKALQTAPLPSADAAVPLLVSFAQDDGKWRTLTTWENAE